MSAAPTTPSEEKPTQMELKQDARDARLSISKSGEEKYRKQLQAIAMENCRAAVTAFGECTKTEGFMVVLNCREQSNAMNACMNQYFNDEALYKYMSDQGVNVDKIRDKKKKSMIPFL